MAARAKGAMRLTGLLADGIVRQRQARVLGNYRTKMTAGIQSIVDAYVKLRKIDVLTNLRAHRQKLLARASDTSHFDFSVSRKRFEQDIAVIEAGLNRLLAQTEWTIRGAMDPLSATAIAGWVQNTQHPDLPVLVGLYIDGKLASETLANRFRPELIKAGVGNGHHGFAFALPTGAHKSINSLEVRAPYETLIVYSRKTGETSA